MEAKIVHGEERQMSCYNCWCTLWLDVYLFLVLWSFFVLRVQLLLCAISQCMCYFSRIKSCAQNVVNLGFRRSLFHSSHWDKKKIDWRGGEWRGSLWRLGGEVAIFKYPGSMDRFRLHDFSRHGQSWLQVRDRLLQYHFVGLLFKQCTQQHPS